MGPPLALSLCVHWAQNSPLSAWSQGIISQSLRSKGASLSEQTSPRCGQAPGCSLLRGERRPGRQALERGPAVLWQPAAARKSR